MGPTREDEFHCKNGACIAGVGRCNGTIECEDSSDETHILCRNDKCDEGEYRCAYGACVVGAACDGVQDCADSSDERLSRCSPGNQTTHCDNGQLLSNENNCDGKVDCTDASDETLARCGDVICEVDQFKCTYGGCAHEYAKCNGVTDCADASDESEELCDRILRVNPGAGGKPSIIGQNHTCILPPQPEHGAYTKFIDPETVPEDNSEFVVLNYTCHAPYRLIGKQFKICNNGIWAGEFPTCEAVCRLTRSLRTQYRCLFKNTTAEGYKECGWLVPMGATVQPVCRFNYYSSEELKPMICRNGKWNYIPKCVPECGRMFPKATFLVAGGGPAKRGELPWHAGIYSKEQVPYHQICGGSVISKKVIISAAHCFWEGDNPKLPCKYAAAAGNLHRAWKDPQDDLVQVRDVIDMKLPPRYKGVLTSFQDDIALVIVEKGFLFMTLVKPVCVDFDYDFDTRQLVPGSMGKVTGWGYTSEAGEPSPVLKVADLPSVSIEQCYNDTPFGFTTYITADKICAGYKNGTATVCKGDSGGGLVFPQQSNGITRYYLRGIVSTAPSDGLKCNTATLTTFTHLLTHKDFIKSHFVNFTESGFQYFDARKIAFYNDSLGC